MRYTDIMSETGSLQILFVYEKPVVKAPVSYVRNDAVFGRTHAPSLDALIVGSDAAEPGDFLFRATSTVTGLMGVFMRRTDDAEQSVVAHQETESPSVFFACTIAHRYLRRRTEQGVKTVKIHMLGKTTNLSSPSLI